MQKRVDAIEERLQKLLSARGMGSRRTVEQWIREGRIQVNGQPAMLGQKADPERDEITVDGVPIGNTPKPTYLMLYKPQGCVTTLSDEKGRKTVADLVRDCGERVWPVGRLDYDSEGLLLLTNDGALTQNLLHPSHQVEKEYYVETTGDPIRALPILQGAMELDGVPLAPAEVKYLGTSGKRERFSIVIHEGRNRQVRRMCTLAGLNVVRLCRMREAGLQLDQTLQPGQWRMLTESEIAYLKAIG